MGIRREGDPVWSGLRHCSNGPRNNSFDPPPNTVWPMTGSALAPVLATYEGGWRPCVLA